jgi:hypothetical protein
LNLFGFFAFPKMFVLYWCVYWKNCQITCFGCVMNCVMRYTWILSQLRGIKQDYSLAHCFPKQVGPSRQMPYVISCSFHIPHEMVICHNPQYIKLRYPHYQTVGLWTHLLSSTKKLLIHIFLWKHKMLNTYRPSLVLVPSNLTEY